MALVAELVTELKTKDVNFTSGLKLATIGVTAFIAAQVALYAAVNKSAEVIDAMVKASERMGISVKSFQELSYAAKITGTSMDSVQNAFKFMEKNIDSATQGNEKLINSFKRLGLNANELKKLAPEKQYEAIAEGAKKLGNHDSQIGLLQATLGKGGLSNYNLIMSNLKDIENEYDKLGLTITNQQAQQSVAFEESQRKLTSIFSGFALQVGAQITPAFTAIIDSITDTILKTGDLKDAAKTVAEYIVDDVRMMIHGVQDLITVLDRALHLWHQFENFGEALGRGIGRISTIADIRGSVAKANPGMSITDIDAEVNRRMAIVANNQDIPVDNTVNDVKTHAGFDKINSTLNKAAEAAKVGGVDSFIPALADSANKAAKALDDVTKAAKGSISKSIKDMTEQKNTKELDRILGDSIKGKSTFQDDRLDQILQTIYKFSTDRNPMSHKDEINSLMGTAKEIAGSGPNDNLDHNPAWNAIKQVQDFVKDQMKIEPKPIKLDIIVRTSPGFYTNITTSPEAKASFIQAAYGLAASAASGVSL